MRTRSRRPALVFLIAGVLAGAFAANGQTPTDAGYEEFTQGRPFMREDELIEFLLVVNGVTYGQLRPVGGFEGNLEQHKRQAVADVLDKIKASLELHPEGYRGDDVTDYLASRDVDRPILGISKSGVTIPRTLSSGPPGVELGPILLREEPDDLRSRKEGSPATVQYVDNRLDGGASQWTTEGALIYPISLEWSALGPGRSLELTFAPAVSWDVQEGGDGEDIEDLQFSIATQAGWNNPSIVQRIEATLKPYAQTTWNTNGLILGATLSFEPLMREDFPLAIGGYRALLESKSDTELSEILAYRIRIQPKIDYSNVVDDGSYFDRGSDDDWLRAGGRLSFSLRFFGEDSPFVLEVAEEFMGGLSGGAKSADLFEASATKWLYQQQVGLTLKYENGETPVSQKEIDQITLGLSVKF